MLRALQASLDPAKQEQALPGLLEEQDLLEVRYLSRPTASTVLESTRPAVRPAQEKTVRLEGLEQTVGATVLVDGLARQTAGVGDKADPAGPADMAEKSQCSFPSAVATTPPPASGEGVAVRLDKAVRAGPGVAGCSGLGGVQSGHPSGPGGGSDGRGERGADGTVVRFRNVNFEQIQTALQEVGQVLRDPDFQQIETLDGVRQRLLASPEREGD